MRLALSVLILSFGLAGSAAAQDVAQTFLEGVRLCADVAEGEDLADVGSEAGWTKTPAVTKSVQKSGVRAFQLTEEHECFVQTATRPADLAALHAGINRLGAERVGLRRVAWGEQKRRPVVNDVYTVWNWEEAANGGVLKVEIRELPGARSNRPQEQALNATVTFAKGASFLVAVPKTLAPPAASTPAAGEKRSTAFELAFLNAIKACHGAMEGKDFSASAALMKMTAKDSGFVRTIDGMTLTMERPLGGTCKVYARGGMMDVGFVSRGVTLFTRVNGLTPVGEKTKVSIPEMGSQFDHWNTRFIRSEPKFIVTLRVQENQAATQPRPADDFAMVAEVDRYAPVSIDIAPQGPLYTAVVEALTLCGTIERADQVPGITAKLGHVKDQFGLPVGRVLDRGAVRIKYGLKTPCELSVFGKAEDDADIYQAVESWLAAAATNVRKLDWKKPRTELRLSWLQSVMHGRIGGRDREVTVNHYSGASSKSATVPRFIVQVGSQTR